MKKTLRRTLRAVAVAAGLTWAALCWHALGNPESYSDQQARTLLFVLAFGSASLGWTARPRKPGGRNKERF